MSWTCLGLLAWLAAAGAADAAAAADAGAGAHAWGTVSLPSRAPLVESRLGFAPGRLRPLPAGAAELTVALSHVNVWAQMPGYFWDGEWTRLLLRGTWTLVPGLELRAELGLLGRSGGRLDGFIMGFHRLVGCTQARRDRYPRDRLRVARELGPDAGGALGPGDAGVGLATPALGLRRTVLRGAAGQLGAGLAVGLPVGGGARRFASSRPALLGELLGEIAVLPGLGALGALGATLAPPGERLYGMALAPLQPFFLLGLRLQLGPRWALVGHWLTQGGAAAAHVLAPLDRSTHEFSLGAQAAVGGLLLELAAIENSIHDANTPDFGVHLGLRVPLRLAKPARVR